MFRTRWIVLVFAACFASMLSIAQELTGSPSAVVPTLVNFNGVLADLNGQPVSHVSGVTFLLYKEQQGGAPLWMETQNVHPDKAGHYSVVLGSATKQGLPADLFASGEARWLGIQVAGEAEQPRILLLSVPYALKAGDAATFGGLPPSAYLLAKPNATPTQSVGASTAPTELQPLATGTTPVTTAGGTINQLAKFDANADIAKSIIFDNGSNVGIGNTKPATKLDVGGAATVRGNLSLPAIGIATSTGGKVSQPLTFNASVFNSGTTLAVNESFRWQAEAVSNNTSTATASLNLLSAQGTGAYAETGLKIGHNGRITFAAGQKFAGAGTILGVTAGTGLTGGGTSGTVTLNVDSTKIPQLQSGNTFTGTEKFTGNVGVGTSPSANGYTPLLVGGTTNFGTWLSLSNTSLGGHTWNLISAGSGNAEGAGNFGITDLTGKSTIWLEGNTRTSTLTATGGVSAATVTATSESGSAILDADAFGANAGGVTPGLRFGGGSSGEGISSNRVIGITRFGLDFYTNYTTRMSVLNDGQVGVGVTNPGAQLGVVAWSNAYPAIYTQGGNAASGSGQAGGDGIDSFGENGDGAANGGSGGVFYGGVGGATGWNGEGVVAFGGSSRGLLGPVTYAGDFQGAVFAKGGLWVPSSSTIMDHPLDPANKFLVHSSVESSDMMNIYNGNVVTNATGEAVVNLPDWFEALNRDFRYQLTTIGQPAQAWIARKIANHAFTIKTDKPNVEISWQVTGIRQDPWANAHRMSVEQPKSDRDAGHYLNPELFGAPEERSIMWARHPEMMKKLKQMRLHHSNEKQAAETERSPSAK